VQTRQTWHHGLVAEWWANFNTDGPEIEYFRRQVEHAQPVLDAGCGTGRLLVPWLQAGIDVDGCDASADMVALCRERARKEGFEPTLFVQPLHGLDPARRYGSIVVCGVFGLGSTRAEDEEALRRLHACLEPGGTLLLDNQVPYSNTNMWPRWTKAGREELPSDWRPPEPEWREAAAGIEYSLQAQVLAFEPLDQSRSLHQAKRRERRRELRHQRGCYVGLAPRHVTRETTVCRMFVECPIREHRSRCRHQFPGC